MNDYPKVLAVYGTMYGRTEQIIRRLADALRKRGLEVSVHQCDQLPEGLALDRYDAFLVGSSVIAGRHHGYVENFVRKYAARLNLTPSAFVSVSGAAGDTRPERQAEARKYVDEFLRNTGWRPTLHSMFGGVIAYTRYGFFLRWMTRIVAGRHGGPTDMSRDHEFTDWSAVDRFAEELAGAFRPAHV